MKEKSTAWSIWIAALSGWTGVMLIVYLLMGVPWFHPGDFSYRTAMAYHGILIPAWLMLVLSYFRNISHSDLCRKLSGAGALSAGILAGTGAILIRQPGLSPGTGMQIAGMVLAEMTVLFVLIISFIDYFSGSRDDFNKVAWWTVTVALAAMLLALPLGHLAGAATDLGDKFHFILKRAEVLNMPANDVLDGFIGSHSHQVLAAFLAAAFAMPFMRKSQEKQGAVHFLRQTGLFVILTATVAQALLYQYCAWFGWEPPDLFSGGPNGLPLDDFILVLLGVGMLLLLPALLAKEGRANGDDDWRYIRGIVAVILLIYMVSVVALGLDIEFHEQFFGHGEGNAPGVPNDLAYIRAHMLLGFMIVPIFLGTLLNADLINSKKQLYFSLGFAVTILVIGFVGIFVWTFSLHAALIEISFLLTAFFLLIFAFQVGRSARYRLRSLNPEQ